MVKSQNNIGIIIVISVMIITIGTLIYFLLQSNKLPEQKQTNLSKNSSNMLKSQHIPEISKQIPEISEQVFKSDQALEKTKSNKHFCLNVLLEDRRVWQLCLPTIKDRYDNEIIPTTGDLANESNSYDSKEECQASIANGNNLKCINSNTYNVQDLITWYPRWERRWWDNYTTWCPPGVANCTFLLA